MPLTAIIVIMKKHLTLALAALLSVAPLLAGCGERIKEQREEPAGIDWPMYGGTPYRTGYSAEALAPPFQVRWEADTGRLEGGAAAAGGRVCVADADGRVHCFKAGSGEVDWAFKANGPIKGQTPLIFDSRVYVGTEKGTFYCLNSRGGAGRDGLRLWEKELGPGGFSSALGEGGKVYVAHGNALLCLEGRKGQEVFIHAETGASSVTAPALGQGRVYFGTDTGLLVCLDAAAGSESWKARVSAEVSTNPVLSEGRVFLGTADNQLWCLSAASGEVLWNVHIPQKVSSPPAVYGSSLVIGTGDEKSLATGVLWCLDAENGSQRWSYETDYASPLQVSVTSRYAFAYNGLALDLSGTGVASTLPLGGSPHAQPAPYGGCLYVCDAKGTLYCLGP